MIKNINIFQHPMTLTYFVEILNQVLSRIHNSAGKCDECSLQKGVVRDLKKQNFESKMIFCLEFYLTVYLRQ